MENPQIEKPAELKITPDLDNKLKALQKRPGKELEGEGQVVISLDDVTQASRSAVSRVLFVCKV